MPNYGDPKYWDRRYKENDGNVFDWLEDYNTLKSIFEGLINKNNKILMLGCGNSSLSEEMYKDGFENIYNIDISSIVIR